jgi:hypothetical protein
MCPYCHVLSDDMVFGLVIGFMGLLKLVAKCNYRRFTSYALHSLLAYTQFLLSLQCLNQSCGSGSQSHTFLDHRVQLLLSSLAGARLSLQLFMAAIDSWPRVVSTGNRLLALFPASSADC